MNTCNELLAVKKRTEGTLRIIEAHKKVKVVWGPYSLAINCCYIMSFTLKCNESKEDVALLPLLTSGLTHLWHNVYLPFICIKEMSNEVLLGKLIQGDILYKYFYCCSFRINEVTVKDLCFRSGPSSTQLCNKINQRNDRGKVKIATLLLGLS